MTLDSKLVYQDKVYETNSKNLDEFLSLPLSLFALYPLTRSSGEDAWRT